MDVSEATRQTPHHGRHPWETARFRVIEFFIQKKLKGEHRHVLEIGSGDAYISRSLAAKHPATRFSCIDIAYTDEFLSTLQTTPHADRIHYFKSAALFESANTPADLILLPDVLEHAEDDNGLLGFATKNTVSTPEAEFLITAPAFQILFSHHDRQLKHHRRYSRRQLEQLCLNKHLQIITSGYFFCSLLPLRWINKWMEKYNSGNKEVSIDNWAGSDSLTRFISLILWFDFKACHVLRKAGIVVPGLSCYCLCKKSRS